MGPGGPMGPRGMMGPGGPGNRMPGPPPPYQGPGGPRGMPPGAMASPNPGSPATSLPMSSPVTGPPMMNSPRHMGSNPGTPVSGAPMSSPVTGPRNSPGIPPQNNPNGKIFTISTCFPIFDDFTFFFQTPCSIVRCTAAVALNPHSLPKTKPI